MQKCTSQSQVLQERRHYTPEKSALWDKLSITQKFSASSLTQFGYDLTYVRNSHNGYLAILQCNDNTATVDFEGDIDTSPQITIRL